MDEADKYLQVDISLLIYTRLPWSFFSFPYSPGLDGSISPMLESQYVCILKLYSAILERQAYDDAIFIAE